MIVYICDNNVVVYTIWYAFLDVSKGIVYYKCYIFEICHHLHHHEHRQCAPLVDIWKKTIFYISHIWIFVFLELFLSHNSLDHCVLHELHECVSANHQRQKMICCKYYNCGTFLWLLHVCWWCVFSKNA